MVSILVALVLVGSVAGTIYAIRRARGEPDGVRQTAQHGHHLALVHAINQARCTSCSACANACPEGVLAMIDGRVEVAHPQRCVQCEACSWACATGALLMHEEGAAPPPLLLPEIDENCQSAIPGLYLVGEVTGQPLVKNAANLGRGVVEHMLHHGLCPGALTSQRFAEGSDAGEVLTVDVAIVGAGPGGLSAALACIQRGLSYIILERDQRIASTIHRMPRGARVSDAPRDIPNVSLLPFRDTTREELLTIWEDLARRVGLAVRLGEAVEQLRRMGNGMFDVRTNVAAYRAQRVILATGGRGKPRTLGVPGENLPKVLCDLDDPNAYRNLPVLVVGGGDRACRAALALADAGARVILSHRGHELSRATPGSRELVLDCADRNLLRLKLESQVERFGHETVTLETTDGARKRYPNRAAFVFVGSEPPLRWLDRLGIGFSERPHSYTPPRSDRLVARYTRDVGGLRPCSDDAAAAAAHVLGHARRAVSDEDIEVPSVLFKPYLPGDVPAQPFRLPSEAAVVTSAQRTEPPLQRSRLGSPAASSMPADTQPGDYDDNERTISLRTPRESRLPREDRTEPQLCVPDISPEPQRQRPPSPHARGDRPTMRCPRLATDDTPVGSPPPGLVADTPELEQFGPMASARDEEGSAPRRAVIVGLAKAMAAQPPRRRRTSRVDRDLPAEPPHPIVIDDEPSEAERRVDFVLVDYDTPTPRAKSLSEIDFDFD